MDEQPQWQPISMLSVFTNMVDEMLASSQEQLTHMQLAREKPHVMDDATLQRVVELYSNQLEDQWLFEEQFNRWLQQNLTPEQTREVERLKVQATKIKACNEQILDITEEIRGSTIDSILAMDELELLDAVLSGQLKPPMGDTASAHQEEVDVVSDIGIKRYHSPSFPPEDNMGFATPVTPSHSLSLLNNYMRTDLLRPIHEGIQRRIDDGTEGSPLDHHVDSLAEVLEMCETNLSEMVERNPFHIDPGYEFDPEKDFLHDVEMMKHHLNAQKKTQRELDEEW